MKSQALILQILFYGLPGSASDAAEVKNLCVSTAMILAGAQVCKDNKDFVADAKKCLDDFKKTVEAHSRALPAILAVKSNASQRLKFSDTISDYTTAINDLQNLIAINFRAEKEMNAYLDNLVRPFNVRDRLEVPCLGDSVDSIHESLQKLREERANLQQAEAAARKNYSLASASKGHLEGDFTILAAPPKAARAPASELLNVSRKTKAGASDITGTSEAAAKEARAHLLPSK